MEEFLVEFDVHVPDGASPSEADRRERSEAAAATELARHGHLVRLWRPVGPATPTALGLYRASDRVELDGLLDALPLRDWMDVTVTPLVRHANDPTAPARTGLPLPEPRLTRVYRLEATVGPPLELGATAAGRRRIVALTGGTFTGPEISGTLVPGASADWQTVLADGTALGDIRYTLQTEGGAVLAVRSLSVRHGPAEVLARLGRGEDVDPSEYTFRSSTGIETGAAGLEWLNKGVFVSVGGRTATGVVYETYLVA
jgi:muconolactone delta-isomerase